MKGALRVFAACAAMGFRGVLRDRATLIGSTLVYVTLMILWSGVVYMIPSADIAPFGYTQDQMVWYLGTAEYIVFAGTEWWFKELQNDIVSSQIHLSLLRPVPNALVRIAGWFGEGLARAILMAPAYLVMMLSLTGGYFPGFGALCGLWASLPLAVFMMACGAYLVGASCLWFVQAEPAFWIWQKAIFLLGAMLWPMAFYPVWARTFMWFTPFPAMLVKGSSWVLGEPWQAHLFGFAHQILWAGLFVAILWRYEAKVLRHIQKTGA